MPNKIYTVVKDGEELERLKTLAAARKLADAEGAEVFSDGKCVYQGNLQVVSEAADGAEEKETAAAEPAAVPVLVLTETDKAKTAKYRLKALMNVRRKPSKNAEIVAVKAGGTLVLVTEVKDGWLHLDDNTWILYEGGRWAEKVD